MFRRLPILAASAVLTTGLAAGCDGSSHCTAVRIADAYEVYAPVVFTVLPEVLPKTIPGLAVDLGLFTADTLARYMIDHKVKDGRTWLLIEQTIQGQRKTTVFELGTARELKVSVNGAQLRQVDLYVRERQVRVVIPQDTPATVTVTDASGGDGVARHGTVAGDLAGTRDLDTGRVFRHTLGKADPPASRAGDVRARAFSINGGLDLVNGARAARFTGPGRPTLAACRSVPATAWASKFRGYGSSGKDLAWCLRTNAGYYGLATPNSGASGGVVYLLWAQPGLPVTAAAPVSPEKMKKC
ncbi:hypothetical protein [Actinomadura fibrosa]|uniref:DUF4382 domain-containing protein n=1 Tax=Actinomadura fibrosa TaxID=111802 RepID=A0ABW2Y011_9ACTN|nr:hypothetical protein [Actinomadura fibrosa]